MGPSPAILHPSKLVPKWKSRCQLSRCFAPADSSALWSCLPLLLLVGGVLLQRFTTMTPFSLQAPPHCSQWGRSTKQSIQWSYDRSASFPCQGRTSSRTWARGTGADARSASTPARGTGSCTPAWPPCAPPTPSRTRRSCAHGSYSRSRAPSTCAQDQHQGGAPPTTR